MRKRSPNRRRRRLPGVHNAAAMANPDHLARALRGTRAWNAWRAENPGVLPDLGEANLGAVDLGGAHLAGANLRGANLSRANLGAATLRGADLGAVDLSGANLRRADLAEAGLRGANLSRANLGAADLSGGNLYAADLSGVDLTGANLHGANLALADLSGADLTNVGWQSKSMRGCFRGVRGLETSFGNALFKRRRGPGFPRYPRSPSGKAKLLHAEFEAAGTTPEDSRACGGRVSFRPIAAWGETMPGYFGLRPIGTRIAVGDCCPLRRGARKQIICP